MRIKGHPVKDVQKRQEQKKTYILKVRRPEDMGT